MARVCQVTGKRTRVGNSIARRGKAKREGGVGIKTTGVTKRKFKPNIQKKRVFVPELGRWITVKVSARALKTMSKNGVYKTLVEAGAIKPIKTKPKKGKKKQS